MERPYNTVDRAFGVTRRYMFKLLSALPFATVASAQASVARTPSAAEGPYYPTPRMRFEDVDNNLVKVEGQVRDAGGEVIVLKGVVLDRNQRPAVGARVEIWQCDADGRYLHRSDSRHSGYDQAFQGFGHDITDANGHYEFRTIKPVPYPGRTPHIHVKVFHQDLELTTQFYLAGHRANQRDFLFRRMSRAQQAAVSMRFDDDAPVPETTVTIRL